MTNDVSAIHQSLVSHPPRCLAVAAVSATLFPDSSGGCNVVWRVAVPGCPNPCQVTGFCDAKPEEATGIAFFGPVGIRACEQTITLFDASQDGYNVVLDAMEENIVHESGPEPDWLPVCYVCSKCGGDQFEVEIELEYLPGAVDAFSANPQLPRSDMFDTFTLRGRCVSCGHVNQIITYEGL